MPVRRAHRTGSFGIIERFSLNTLLFRLVNSARHPWVDTFCIFLLPLGSGWILLPVVIVIALNRIRLLRVLLVAIAVETILVLLLKEACPQPRPVSLLSNVYLVEAQKWNSFPSGDTAMAFALAWSLKSGAHRLVQTGFIFYALLIAYERIYLGAHFPLDVLAGAGIGIDSAFLAQRLFQRQPTQPAAKEQQVEDPRQAN